MRLCFVADILSLHARRWANHFSLKGHEVHLITRRFDRGAEGLDQDVRVHHLARLLPVSQVSIACVVLSAVAWSYQVRSVLRRVKPDVMHAHFLGVPGYLGALSGFHPFVQSVWGSDALVFPRQNPVYRVFTRRALRKADHIICVSDVLQEEIIRLGADGSRITATPIGVDTEAFNPALRNRALFQPLGIEDEPVVISTRSLGPVYDVGTLVRAIPLVLDEVPEVRFVIVGAGFQRSYLEDLAKELGVAGSCRFLGWVPNNNLGAYLASADVYVSTSLSDGTSISLLEALACGVPPVVSDIPANRPWVVEGENGFLFPAQDHGKLAAMIVRLLRDAGLRKRMGVFSRNVARERGDFRTEMARVERLYEELSLKGN